MNCLLSSLTTARENSVNSPKSVGKAEFLHQHPKVDTVTENDNTFPETKTIAAENGYLSETQDKGAVSECLGVVSVYDQWVAPPVSGTRPKGRYEHGAAVIDDKMYVFGGNHNGRYLNDLQVLDLRSWKWSKVEVQAGNEGAITTCAGHSLIPWDRNKLLSVAGHTKDPSETLQVKVFDLQTRTWSTLKTYGKPPVSRGGQSVTPVGSTLVIFGGQDAKRSLMNDLHILDLETMTWDEIDTLGAPPSPRSDHTAAVRGDRYLLIFGGGSHATCFNDLHILDLQTMEWSRPTQQGEIPSPRAGHAGFTVGENWFLVGGGDNKSGVSENVVLNMSTLVWSVITTVRGLVPLASEGSSLVLSSFNDEDILVSFGGYNGRYNNEVNVLKPTVQNATNATRDVESEFEIGQEGKMREIVMDNVDSEPMSNKVEETDKHFLAALKGENNELVSSLSKKKMQTLQLKQELTETETHYTDLYKELQSLRDQLAAEQSRCFKLEVDVVEMRQKLQTMETLQKEIELLQRQKAASEQAALSAKQRQNSSGVKCSRWSSVLSGLLELFVARFLVEFLGWFSLSEVSVLGTFLKLLSQLAEFVLGVVFLVDRFYYWIFPVCGLLIGIIRGNSLWEVPTQQWAMVVAGDSGGSIGGGELLDRRWTMMLLDLEVTATVANGVTRDEGWWMSR
ncbi:unnamed protein product [Fraxinus pennsylvanica]|uniref:Acyl-CoA-binding domain-containing protein n=1 Tax=Fraxinus pennsylvanica TaxID=56036 RepID=A0AAD2DYH5_9LAMI|nr:unnamed protein product [Fraxinus pennsylvanica]